MGARVERGKGDWWRGEKWEVREKDVIENSGLFSLEVRLRQGVGVKRIHNEERKKIYMTGFYFTVSRADYFRVEHSPSEKCLFNTRHSQTLPYILPSPFDQAKYRLLSHFLNPVI